MEVTDKMKELLRNSAEPQAVQYHQELAIALNQPVRQAIFAGDIHSWIFEDIEFQNGEQIDFQLDEIAPGTEKDHVAYTIPNHGYIPLAHVESDYIMMETYKIGASEDWNIEYARRSRWDVLARSVNRFGSKITKKKNDDAWHVVLAAGTDRNIVVFDSDAAQGQFTKRLVSLMTTTARRNGGGNSSSINRKKLTDICLSPEGIEDMRNWNVGEVDEVTRREIYLTDDETMMRVFQKNLHPIDELGDGQEYQNFFVNQLGGSLASGDIELVVGLCLGEDNVFIAPRRGDVEIFIDPMLHRHGKQGIYGWARHTYGILDNRNVLLGSF